MINLKIISEVIIFPPKGITAVCLILPSLNIAKSVVPRFPESPE